MFNVYNEEFSPGDYPVCECEGCGAELWEDDYYYDINGDRLCRDCAENYLDENRVKVQWVNFIPERDCMEAYKEHRDYLEVQ